MLPAEDNLVNQKVAVRHLERLGHRVDSVGNGFEALESLRHSPYDVVRMDVQMPEMDRLEATRRICAEWPRDHRPWIIALTVGAFLPSPSWRGPGHVYGRGNERLPFQSIPPRGPRGRATVSPDRARNPNEQGRI